MTVTNVQKDAEARTMTISVRVTVIGTPATWLPW